MGIVLSRRIEESIMIGDNVEHPTAIKKQKRMDNSDIKIQSLYGK